MRRFSLLLLAVSLIILVPSSTDAWEVCETSVETLDFAGEVTFTSSFCDCENADIITIEVIPADPTVVIDSVVFIKATPHWQTNESWAEQLSVTPYIAEALLYWVTEKTRTIHLWLYLSTGEHIGVNAHFLRN